MAIQGSPAMKMFKLVCTGAALCLSLPVAAQQEDSPAGEATYEDSMRCAALYLHSAVQLGDDDSRFEAILEDRATRWLTMAMMRDGEEGDRAERELDTVFEGLTAKLDGFGDDEEARNDFALEHYHRCDLLEAANAEEFQSIELEGDE